jgi:uncharacterized protein involved in outer membrane biogenesis
MPSFAFLQSVARDWRAVCCLFPRQAMNARRWLALGVVLVLIVVVAAVVLALPAIVRHVAVARVEAMTGRDASIDAVEISLLRGRVTVHGFRLADRDGAAPLAELGRLDLHVALSSLLSGHLRVHELVLSDSAVRLVRLPDNRLNVSDLLRTSEGKDKGGDLTIERFRVERGASRSRTARCPSPGRGRPSR